MKIIEFLRQKIRDFFTDMYNEQRYDTQIDNEAVYHNHNWKGM